MYKAATQEKKFQVGNFAERGNEQITPSEGRENCMKCQNFIRGPTHVTHTDVWVSRGDTLSLFKRRGNPCRGDALC